MESRLLRELAGSSADNPVRVGRYDVVGRLGLGGMGTVYAAIDRDRQTRVALKTLIEADAAAGVRLKREFRIVADLAHPNLVPVYELGSQDGLWFFTMELVDGIGFTRWACGEPVDRATARLPVTQATTRDMQLARDGVEIIGPSPAPPAVAMPALRDALAQLANGLSALHDAGLWHGDVKPENILIRSDGRVVVVDFGLVESLGTAPRTSPTVGTPAYMSSEQLAGAGAGAPSDWYAVGTMLYEVLTRRLPFDADSMLDLYFQKTHHTPASPRDLVPETPDDLSDLAMSLLQAAPERRPNGAELVRLFSGEDRVRWTEPARSTFVGRKRELRMIEQAYGIARSGTPMVVHALGPSGIGKSAILRSFTRGVEDIDRALVLRGRCYERESVPYKAFDGIVDELASRLAGERYPEYIGELARVFPVLRAVPAIARLVADDAHAAIEASIDASLLRTRAWIALRELLAMLAEDRPVVLAIDDLQWADADSAQLLESIVRDVPMTARLMIVASYRTVEAAANQALASYFDVARALAADPRRVVEIPLGPLPRAEAEQVARSVIRGIGGSATAARLEALVEESAGVPFFIEELARYSASEARMSLDDAIRARVWALPDEQRALIEVVAIAEAPIPQAIVFEAAGLPAGALPALLALRSASLVSWAGSGIGDLVSTYHDRIRESVIAGLDDEHRRARHRAVGCAMLARHRREPDGPWVYQALRHLAAADERDAIPELALAAGQRARRTAAFPLAFACFERGIAALSTDAWEDKYELTLHLHSGAAEAAYLSAEWAAMDRRCAEVGARGRTPLDRLVAWEVKIDAFIGRREYLAALEAGREALASLGIALPDNATPAELGASVATALAELETIGPDALAAMPDVADPAVAAAMRIQVRLAPAAYFGRQMLLPIIACNLISESIATGLSFATPYALALFGLVLNAMGRYPTAHVYGQLALRLVDRWPDRRLEAATRHVALNLVTAWMQPLDNILEPLREVWDIGRRTGDLEYASYAAHGYVHDAMYAGRPLAPLLDEALSLGAQMRALGQVNAVHVHHPFEQLLRGYTGRLPNAPRLDDERYSETAELDASLVAGSRSGVLVTRVAMGLARFYLGARHDALAQFEAAYAYRDAGPSVWHLPIIYQHYAIAACAQLAMRPDLRAVIEACLAELRVLAEHCAANFAHRVAMVEAELARADGDLATAAARSADALALARAGGWTSDIALAEELSGDLDAARATYRRWGAPGIADRLSGRSSRG